MKHQFKYKDNNHTDIMFETHDKTQCQKRNLE